MDLIYKFDGKMGTSDFFNKFRKKIYWVGLCPLPSKGLIPRVHVSCGTFFIFDMSPLADLRGAPGTPFWGSNSLNSMQFWRKILDPPLVSVFYESNFTLISEKKP